MIAYHGTCAENVQSILDNGFQPESWFARWIDDAIAYGGPFVFAVYFSDDPAMWHGEPWPDNFQFHISGWHGLENIKALKIVLLGENKKRG